VLPVSPIFDGCCDGRSGVVSLPPGRETISLSSLDRGQPPLELVAPDVAGPQLEVGVPEVGGPPQVERLAVVWPTRDVEGFAFRPDSGLRHAAGVDDLEIAGLLGRINDIEEVAVVRECLDPVVRPTLILVGGEIAGLVPRA
jgi:hypothetical protein